MDFTIIAYSEIWRRYLSVKVRENFPLFYIIPSNLLVDVFRSQSIAVFGNVMVAMSLAVLIAFAFQHQTGEALMNQAQIDYQLIVLILLPAHLVCCDCRCMVVLLRYYFGLF